MFVRRQPLFLLDNSVTIRPWCLDVGIQKLNVTDFFCPEFNASDDDTQWPMSLG